VLYGFPPDLSHGHRVVAYSFLRAWSFWAWSVFKPDENLQKIMAQSPLPLAVQQGMAVGGIAVQLVCGIFMLRGRIGREFFMSRGWQSVCSLVWQPIPIELRCFPER
jgi:hypothetical protein